MQLNLLLSHLISSQRSSVLLLILVSVSVSSDDFFLFLYVPLMSVAKAHSKN